MHAFLLKLAPGWLRTYRARWLAGDLSAGGVTALMVVPQSMAYAILAGLPPVCGLYASILPTLVYAWLGSSSVQSVGTMAITAVMMGGVLADLRPVSAEEAVALACVLALLTGGILLLASFLRLGSLMSLVSRPVLSGFTTGSALMIAWSQLPYLLGAQPPAHGAGLSWPSPGLQASLLGIGACLMLWLARPVAGMLRHRLALRRSPGDLGLRLMPFAVIVGAAIAVQLAGLHAIRVVGEVPAGLPDIGLHWVTSLALDPAERRVRELVPSAVSMAMVVFLFGQSSAISLGRRRGERIDNNRELLALGASNIAAGLSGGLPVTGSLSRSAVNAQAGANTQLASVIAVLVLLAALSASTHWLSLLPLPALAATILVAVVGMMEWQTLPWLWRFDRRDAVAFLATALAVIVLGFNEAMAIGVALSLALLGASWWQGGLLGRLRPGSIGAVDSPQARRGPYPRDGSYARESPCALDGSCARDGSIAPDGPCVLWRIEGALVFVNAEQTAEAVRVHVHNAPGLAALILDLSDLIDLDTSGYKSLAELARHLDARTCRLILVRPCTALDARLRRGDDVLGGLGAQVVDTLDAAQAAAKETQAAARAA